MNSERLRARARAFYRTKDVLWLTIWIGGLLTLWIWDLLFLNAPALARIERAFLNSLLTGALTVLFSLLLGWGVGIAMHRLETEGKGASVAVGFLLDLIRSIPQILIVLAGYVLLTLLLQSETIQSGWAQLLWIAATLSAALFLEIADTVRSRIEYFRTLDFVDAMLCCGISESRILNVEILWKNSRSHLLHKVIAVFGASMFLQCSIDFIVSVGLSTDVSLTNLPLSLGGLLATLDSKQDILAVSTLFTNPGYVSEILVTHLQGISSAFCIIFTLLCMYKIGNAFVRRHRLV